MQSLQTERQTIQEFRNKIICNEAFTKEELIDMCSQFEDTLELANVSFKIIDKITINYSKLQKTVSKH